MGVANLVVILLMIAVVTVLIAGFVLMMRGGEANRKYGNKLMVARVALQALVILMIVAMFAFSQH